MALVVNGVANRDEVVLYFKELYNQKINLLDEDVIECLIDKSLEIHPQGLEEEISKANAEDVLGFFSPAIDELLEEQSSKSIECVLEEAKMYPENNFVLKEDVLSLSNWLGNTYKDYDEDSDEDYNLLKHLFDHEYEDGYEEDDDDLFFKNTTTVRNAPKVGRNQPCPCGSGKKYKKCCGK